MTEEGEMPEVNQAIELLKVSKLEPGDTLVIFCKSRLPKEAYVSIDKKISEIFPGHKAIIFEYGMRLKIVKRKSAEERDESRNHAGGADKEH